MEQKRVIEVKQQVMASNSAQADRFRQHLSANGTTLVDVMASPGAGKTTLILGLIERMREKRAIAVIEADIESHVDSEKIKAPFSLFPKILIIPLFTFRPTVIFIFLARLYKSGLIYEELGTWKSIEKDTEYI